jgi:hypothetical protein
MTHSEGGRVKRTCPMYRCNLEPANLGPMALVLMVLVGCLADRNSLKPGQELTLANVPVLLQGTEAAGIRCAFVVEQYSIHSGRIEGYVHLANDDAETKQFPMYAGFSAHVAVEDTNGRPVVRVGPLLLPMKLVRDVPAHGYLDVPYTLNLTEHFRLQRGGYRLYFIYDLRLYGPQNATNSPIVPWSREKVWFGYQTTNLLGGASQGSDGDRKAAGNRMARSFGSAFMLPSTATATPSNRQ